MAGPAAELLPINLAAAHLRRILVQPPAALLVNCGTLACQRTLGVCVLVSQLLVLRQSGASSSLRNANPMRRYRLHLHAFFPLAD